ncbi:MAG: class II glutamine amidotransferase [Patescibacteria group bacterium]
MVSTGDAVMGLFCLGYKQQHRSHRSAGMVVWDADECRYLPVKGMGNFTEIFTREKLAYLHGNIGIAHVRWATHGELSAKNIHPLAFLFRGKRGYIVHNGEISCRNGLEEQFRNYQPEVSADTKFIAGLIETAPTTDFLSALQYAFSVIKGTYSLLILYDNAVYAVRDVTGNRPLFMGGWQENSVCFASESSALVCLGLRPRDMREVAPGEMVVVRGSDLSVESHSIAAPPDIPRALRFCMIELLYSMYPTTIVLGRTVRSIRERLGYELGARYRPPADIVVGVPDSGVSAGIGYSAATGIPYVQGIIRYHQSGRIFYHAVDERAERYRLKYDADFEALRDRRVVLVDDTLFASDTIRNVITICVEAGAREIHVAIPSPMITRPCYYGTPTSSDHRRLIARDYGGDLEAIRTDINRTVGGRLGSLAFLTLEEAKRAIVATPPVLSGYGAIGTDNFCDACFLGGRRHIPVDVD